MIKVRSEGRPGKATQKNNTSVQLDSNSCSDLYKYRCSTTDSDYLSNAETFFNIVEKVEVLPVQGKECLCRLHIQGKDKPLVIGTDEIESFTIFRRIYYRTYGIWCSWIGRRSWALVLEALFENKTVYLTGVSA